MTLVYRVAIVDTLTAMQDSVISAFIKRHGVLLLDGGLATELEHRGHDLDNPLWSASLLASNPDEITAVHLAYLRAGADCLVTSSYQATIQGFEQLNLSSGKARSLLAGTVELALRAREEFISDGCGSDSERLAPLIAASIGPYGAYLADGSEYSGRYGKSKQQLRDFHEPRWAILDDSMADLLACETIPSLVETEALLELLSQSRHRSAWISFTCTDTETLCDGTPLAECAALLADSERVVAVGVNCLAPELVLPIVTSLREWLPGKAIIVYPNSGEHYSAGSRCWTGNPETSEFGQMALSWKAAGASIIGGCCRIGPAHIATLREVLKS